MNRYNNKNHNKNINNNYNKSASTESGFDLIVISLVHLFVAELVAWLGYQKVMKMGVDNFSRTPRFLHDLTVREKLFQC